VRAPKREGVLFLFFCFSVIVIVIVIIIIILGKSENLVY
jgi:hypothetical protein